MKLAIFCPLWGSENLPFEDFCRQVSEAGFAGLEMILAPDRPTQERQMESLQRFGLAYIGHHANTFATSVEEYKNLFEEQIRRMVPHRPLLVNSQTGMDFFSFEENLEILQFAEELASETGLRILHETHRGKFSFHARLTADYLQALPHLRLTADFSHWCNVSESLLEGQDQWLAAAIARSDHFHTRVGFPEGPQINHPAAPEWAETVERHFQWWDAIVAQHRQAGTEQLTCTTEFGPAPYMPLLPFTRQPVSSQWEANLCMKNLLEERYG